RSGKSEQVDHVLIADPGARAGVCETEPRSRADVRLPIHSVRQSREHIVRAGPYAHLVVNCSRHPGLHLVRKANVSLDHVVLKRPPTRQLVLHGILRRGGAHEVVEKALAVERFAGRKEPGADATARGERFAALDTSIRWIPDRVQSGYAVGQPKPAEAIAKRLAADHLMSVRLPEAGNDGQLRCIDVARVAVGPIAVRF